MYKNCEIKAKPKFFGACERKKSAFFIKFILSEKNIFKREPNFSRHIKLNPTNIALLLQRQHKVIENRLLNKMLLSVSVLLSVYCDLRFLRLRQRQSFSSSCTHYSAKLRRFLNSTSDHSCRIYFRFLNITACIKNRVYNNFNLRYFMSSNRYKSFMS